VGCWGIKGTEGQTSALNYSHGPNCYQISDDKETVGKDQSVLEMVAYRDIWGKGSDSYLHMMHERLTLMKELLSERGSIYVHCDWRVNNALRYILDDLLGQDAFVNEIIWKRSDSHSDSKDKFSIVKDNILFYSKSGEHTWNPQYLPLPDKTVDSWYRHIEAETGRR